MPATLVSNEDIPRLADQVDSPGLLKVLRRLQERGFIHNGTGVNQEAADALRRLTDLGLADVGYAEIPASKPFIWVSNSNGERVLKYLESQYRYKVLIHPRARTALTVLSDDDRESVRAVIESLVLRDEGEWPADRALRINQDKPVYLLRVTPDLRAFIRVSAPAAEVELFDLVREEALNLFRERSPGTPQ
jgi:hypothetical protein